MVAEHALAGLRAVVTGASRGLGYAIARRLASEGARVAACARSAEGLSALSDACGGIDTAAFDLRDADALRAFLREVGPVDVLVNNAGVGWYKPLAETTPAELDVTLDVNLRALVHACHAVLPSMLERRSGYIVNIASDLARRPLAQMAPYVAAKHGVLGFTASLLREVKDHGVRVTAILPGIVDTYFGGGQPGRDAGGALRPEAVADAVVRVLTLPREVVVDELTLHPLGQAF